MINLSFFSINDYKERIPSLYPHALAEECKLITDTFSHSGDVVGDKLQITNPQLEVDNCISNTAIYFVCIELLGNGPSEIKEEDGKKIIYLE